MHDTYDFPILLGRRVSDFYKLASMVIHSSVFPSAKLFFVDRDTAYMRTIPVAYHLTAHRLTPPLYKRLAA